MRVQAGLGLRPPQLREPATCRAVEGAGAQALSKWTDAGTQAEGAWREEHLLLA